MIKQLTLILLVASCVAGAATTAHADSAPKNKDAAADARTALNTALGLPGLTAPANLAAGALSIGPDDVKPITSVSSLGSSVLSGIGADGSLKGAYGLSVSPFALGTSIDLEAYKKNMFQRWVARTSLSGALSQAETSDGNGTMAVGLQTVLFDRGDMLLRQTSKEDGQKLALETCAIDAAAKITDRDSTRAPRPPSTGETESDGPVPDALLGSYLACAEGLNKATWNDTSLGVGVVTVARATGNKVSDLNQSNTVVYVSLSYGFDGIGGGENIKTTGGTITSDCDKEFRLTCNAQLVVRFKYESDAAYELKGAAPTSAETFGVGTKLVVGNPRTVGYAYYRQETAKFMTGDRDLHEWGLGVETKVGEKTWVNFVAGRKDDDIRGNETTVKASFSWDITSAAALVNPFAN